MLKNFTQYIFYSVQHFFENILIQLFLIQLLNRSLETSDDDLKNLKGVLMGSSRSSSVRQVYMDGNSFNKAPQSTIHCVFLSHNWWIVTNWTSRNSSVPAAAAAVIFYSDHDVTMQKKSWDRETSKISQLNQRRSTISYESEIPPMLYSAEKNGKIMQ